MYPLSCFPNGYILQNYISLSQSLTLLQATNLTQISPVFHWYSFVCEREYV